MKRYNPYDYDENTVVWVKTYEQNDIFLRALDKFHISMADVFMIYSDRTAYRPRSHTHGKIYDNGLYCDESKYTVLRFEDFDWDEAYDEAEDPPEDDEAFQNAFEILMR